MAEINPTITYYAYLDGEWVALEVYGGIRVRQGITDSSPMERIADVGEMNLVLLNDDDKYTPGHASCLTGWKTGVPIKEVITYDGVSRVSRFHIMSPDGIQIDPRPYGSQKAKITALDWMDYAMRSPVVNPTLLSDVTGDEVIDAVVTDMVNQPQNTDYSTGINEFATALDNVNDNTVVYDELARVANSEFGFVYVKPDATDGETLVFEAFTDRSGLDTETVFDTDKTFDGDDAFSNASTPSGKNILNTITAYAYPRRVDTSAVVLFTLAKPQLIASGKSLKLRGTYVNPDGKNRSSGYNMVTPVATTDYLMNTAKDGSGTNKTANLSVVETEVGTSGFLHTLTNGAAENCWITKYKYRGYGIYIENPINYMVENDTSISENGSVNDKIHQKYQQNLDFGTLVSNSIVAFEKDGETRFEYVIFTANASDEYMHAFLELGIGDMVHLQSAKAAIDGYYYIQGYEYVISGGGIITVKYYVAERKNLVSGLSLTGAIFNGVGSTDAIDFGTLPYLSNLTAISVSAWIYTHDLASNNQALVTFFSDAAGFNFYIGTDGRVYLVYIFDNGTNSYRTTNVVITKNTWHHVEFTRNLSSSTNAPNIYVDGVNKALQKLAGADGGALVSETGNQLMIGNAKTATLNYSYPFHGWMKGVRIYNVRQASSTVGYIYAAGKDDTDTITSHLVFQAFCAKTRDLAALDGYQIYNDDYRMLDNIHQVVGIPNGTPTPYTDASDPAQIKTLLHFEGADTSTTMTDATGRSWTAYGNAQIDTAKKKMGSASLLLDGTGDYIRAANSSDFYPVDEDFDIDFWIRSASLPTTGQSQVVWAQYVNSSNYIRLEISNQAGVMKLGFAVRESGTVIIYMYRTLPFASINVWYHYRVSRVSGVYRMFRTGKLLGTVYNNSATITDRSAGGYAYIGQSGGNSLYFNGWIDEFRIRKGVGTSEEFSVPTIPYAY